MNYRADIDGLRAVAVIPVVLYHLGVPGFGGGFVGVDVFFVISGFLITGILYEEAKRGTFSIANFYHRRIKRIFPALFTVLIVTAIFAYLLLMNGEFKKFQGSVFSTLLFYSNYHFMFDVGYFADAAEKKPLLHMWSLAVEEQFYVFFPLVLMLIYRFIKAHIVLILYLLTLLSFVYSTFLVHSNPSDAFYSTPARAWELMLGSILAVNKEKLFVKNTSAANLLSWLGLGMILVAVFWFTNNTVFPGPAAALPVLGSCFIIMSGAHAKTTVKSLLSSKSFVFIGLISYSLYLWHWPVIVLYGFYTMDHFNWQEMLIMFLCMILLAYISWKFIEAPFRKGSLFSQKFYKVNWKSAALLVSMVTIGLVAIADLRKQYSPDVTRIVKARGAKNKAMPLKNCNRVRTQTVKNLRLCHVGDLSQKNDSFVVIGDSHGRAFLAGIDKSANEHGLKGIFLGNGGCLSLVGTHQVGPKFDLCETRINGLIEYLARTPEIKYVFLSSRWSRYATGLTYKNTSGRDIFIKDAFTDISSFEENSAVFERSFVRTLETISKMKKNVVVISQLPEAEWGSNDAARVEMLNLDFDLRPQYNEFIERQSIPHTVFEKYQKEYGFDIIDPAEFMCEGEYCIFFDEGIPIYRDNNHITKSFSLKLSEMYDESFTRLKHLLVTDNTL